MRLAEKILYVFVGAALALSLTTLQDFMTKTHAPATDLPVITASHISATHGDPRRQSAAAKDAQVDSTEGLVSTAQANSGADPRGGRPEHQTQAAPPASANPAPEPSPATSPSLSQRKYPGLRPIEEQLRETEVKSRPYTFAKDANGFCRLSGFELSGPLYPKGKLFPHGLRYEDFQQFNGSKDHLARWHKLKFHAVLNDKVVFLIPPKSGSTSTRGVLSTMGRSIGTKFNLKFELGRWWNLVQAGNETRSLIEWFFSPEVHGNKHFFTTIREPYSRLDSGTGSCLNRMKRQCKNQKQRLYDLYSLGFYHESYVHIYPQSYFYSHVPNLTVFRIGDSYTSELNRWFSTLFPDRKFNFKVGKGNQREGKGVDRNMTQLLLEKQNQAWLRDYVFDEVLWKRANELGC